ncbi:hypothetical protein DUF692 [Psychromonas ingrahamii 37]|uniref:UPF0276 protein Ping_0944 n=1 Tax=Psychromonas ingrahamii (strain DSM 17664 / CCUG 51855 / 37) TaxID=357804 RepID=Y944_PSYIN|nr:DUF692 domain-containing protein [Psychromonas ingrahamii]A1STH1.1 RecName: Full=UPF0276 protein Ping_0944 [Psychromonas ingrahamii 37]ABM02786.1 hypothetical protein DUF692 [Psychromonas ingrahamii 37]
MKKIQAGTVGIGLRHPHYQTLLDQLPTLGFLEVHSENYFNPHSQNRFYLEQIAAHYPLSFHGIGLSIGSSEDISKTHLQNLKQIIDIFQPVLVSDHISWSSLQSNFFNDLLPIPYTKKALSCFVNNLNQTQEHLQRQILIENPSSYLEYNDSEMSEPEFINEIVKQTGCGLLLDLNNVYVSATNHQFSVEKYLDIIDHTTVQEIHLAGFTQKQVNNSTMLIDTHSTLISQSVWDIYQTYMSTKKTDALTLIEWDLDIPKLGTLIEEHNKAINIKQSLCTSDKHV